LPFSIRTKFGRGSHFFWHSQKGLSLAGKKRHRPPPCFSKKFSAGFWGRLVFPKLCWGGKKVGKKFSNRILALAIFFFSWVSRSLIEKTVGFFGKSDFKFMVCGRGGRVGGPEPGLFVSKRGFIPPGLAVLRN